MAKSDWKEREIGVLWKKENGTPRYCGYVEIDGKKHRVIIFPNRDRGGNRPDLRIYKDER